MRFPIDQRDTSTRQVCLRDGAGPVVAPRVVSEVNGRRPPQLRRGLRQITRPVVQSEQRPRSRLQNGRPTGICGVEAPSVQSKNESKNKSKNYDARYSGLPKNFSHAHNSKDKFHFRESPAGRPSLCVFLACAHHTTGCPISRVLCEKWGFSHAAHPMRAAWPSPRVLWVCATTTEGAPSLRILQGRAFQTVETIVVSGLVHACATTTEAAPPSIFEEPALSLPKGWVPRTIASDDLACRNVGFPRNERVRGDRMNLRYSSGPANLSSARQCRP